jgi:hypothetical protein
MTDPVTLTLSEGTWWLVGAFAFAGLVVCLFEAYYCMAGVIDDLRHRLRHPRHD